MTNGEGVRGDQWGGLRGVQWGGLRGDQVINGER